MLPLSVPFLIKYLIESLMAKCGFVLYTPDLCQVSCYCGLQNLVYGLNCWLEPTLFSIFDIGHPIEVKWESKFGTEKCQVQGWNQFDIGVICREVTIWDNDQGQRSRQKSERGIWDWEPTMSGRGRTEVTGNQSANICQIVIFITWMVLFDPVAILQQHRVTSAAHGKARFSHIQCWWKRY